MSRRMAVGSLDLRADGPALRRLLCHLMVHGIHMVEVSQAVRIDRVESLDPAFDDFAR